MILLAIDAFDFIETAFFERMVLAASHAELFAGTLVGEMIMSVAFFTFVDSYRRIVRSNAQLHVIKFNLFMTYDILNRLG